MQWKFDIAIAILLLLSPISACISVNPHCTGLIILFETAPSPKNCFRQTHTHLLLLPEVFTDCVFRGLYFACLIQICDFCFTRSKIKSASSIMAQNLRLRFNLNPSGQDPTEPSSSMSTSGNIRSQRTRFCRHRLQDIQSLVGLIIFVPEDLDGPESEIKEQYRTATDELEETDHDLRVIVAETEDAVVTLRLNRRARPSDAELLALLQNNSMVILNWVGREDLAPFPTGPTLEQILWYRGPNLGAFELFPQDLVFMSKGSIVNTTESICSMDQHQVDIMLRYHNAFQHILTMPDSHERFLFATYYWNAERHRVSLPQAPWVPGYVPADWRIRPAFSTRTWLDLSTMVQFQFIDSSGADELPSDQQLRAYLAAQADSDDHRLTNGQGQEVDTNSSSDSGTIIYTPQESIAGELQGSPSDVGGRWAWIVGPWSDPEGIRSIHSPFAITLNGSQTSVRAPRGRRVWLSGAHLGCDHILRVPRR